jgi:glycosyltransferase involved in cell wall biosynthesis
MQDILNQSSPTISAVVITHNEEKNLRACLQSLRFCHEVVIVDRDSSDSTQAVASEFNARFYPRPDWKGFGIQKQRCLELASGDWILSLDADERISNSLAKEILSAINLEHQNGFRIKRQNFFLGKHLRFGGWSDETIIRLARKRYARFDDSQVHEKLLVEGSIGNLKSPLLHLSYQDFDDIFEKTKRYALAASKRKGALPKWAGGPTGLAYSIATFVLRYFVKFGFLDGCPGLMAAAMKSQEAFWKHVARTLRDR